MFDALIRRGRRGAVAFAAVAALAPVAAGCAAGANAQTNRPYSPTEGKNTAVSGMKLRDTFILGPRPGQKLTPGDLAPLYVVLANDGPSADRLVSVATDGTFGAAKISGGGIDIAPTKAVRVAQKPAITLGKLAKPLMGGESVKVTFTFAHAGAVSYNVPVLVRDKYFATYPPAPKPKAKAGHAPGAKDHAKKTAEPHATQSATAAPTA